MADIMSALRKRGLELTMIQNAAVVFSRMPHEWHEHLCFNHFNRKWERVSFFWKGPSAQVSCTIAPMWWLANYAYHGEKSEFYRMRIGDPVPQALIDRINFVISDIKINKK